MNVEVIFHTSSSPKKHTDVDAIYTKGDFLCIQLKDGLIMRYPMINVFSVASKHHRHLGTTRKDD